MSGQRNMSRHPFLSKALSSLLCLMMVSTLPTLNGNMALAEEITEESPPNEEENPSPPPENVGMESTAINPRILIQHYYEYPYQKLGSVLKTVNLNSSQYQDFTNRTKIYDELKKIHVAWNTNSRFENSEDKELLPKNYSLFNIPFSTTSLSADQKQAYITARKADPKFILSLFKEGETKDEVEFEYVLYRLFKDDAIRYFEKPQMRYMNKLFNSTDTDNDGVPDYNENYTLYQIWLATVDPKTGIETTEEGFQFKSSSPQDLPNIDNNNNNDFIIINIPDLEGADQHHDPSKVQFTNDPHNPVFSEDSGWDTIEDKAKNIKYAVKKSSDTEEEKIEEVMILVTDGLIVRLVFDPTESKGTPDAPDYISENVDFFDYDITNGYIYPTENAAKKAYTSSSSGLQLVALNANNELKLAQEINGAVVCTDTSPTGLSINSTTQKLDGNNKDNYYFPTSTQGNSVLANQQWFALTYKQGINNNGKNFSAPNDYYTYAFGNTNTSTGLASVTWMDNGVTTTPNKYNTNNDFRITSSDSTTYRPAQPYFEGATFNLGKGILQGNSSNWNNPVIEWNNGVKAPQLFDINNAAQDGMTVYSKKLGTNYFPLVFKRIGGTYVLDKVLKYDSQGNEVEANSPPCENLSKIQDMNVNNIISNQFWPMDKAPSYGTDGHDLKFGKGTQNGSSRTGDPNRQAVGSIAQTPNLTTLMSDDYKSKAFPESDDLQDHNAYFGMKFQIPFTLEEGYAAPLNYFFYGDDDMFVFLSKCERDDQGNIISMSDTQQVADLGGVHSSIGTYVNLWNFIREENKEPIYTKSTTLNGVPEEIYYYKASEESFSETASFNTDSSDQPKSQDYVLTVFYTERGSAGSSCYMRFSVPFQGLTTVSRAQNGEIRVDKEVKTAVIAESSSTQEDEMYVFQLNLTNADGSTFMNVYPIAIHDSNHTSAFADLKNQKAIVNSNAANVDGEKIVTNIEERKQFRAITDGGRFTLTTGQHAYIYGLPRSGPYGDNYTFTVEEVGTYSGSKNFGETTPNLYDNCTPLSSDTTTTFRSGYFTNNTDDPAYGDDQWSTGFEQDNKFSNQIGSENKVEFVNTLAPYALRLEKHLKEKDPNFNGTFTFQINLKDNNDKGFTQVPWFSSIPPDDLQEEANKNPAFYDQEPLTSENGDFTLELKPDEIVILYGLPKDTQFSITETGINGDHYSYNLDDILVTTGTADKDVENKTVSGVLNTLPATPPTSLGSSNVAVSAALQYINKLERLYVLKVEKILASTPDVDLTTSDRQQNFDFQITLKNSDDTPSTISELLYRIVDSNDDQGIKLIELTNGVGKFSLTSGQEAEIYDFPEGVKWEIQELDGNTPIKVGEKVNNYTLIAVTPPNSGTISSTQPNPHTTFVNLKNGPDAFQTGLKILDGDREEPLGKNEFTFLLKGVRVGSSSPSEPVNEGENFEDSDVGSDMEEETPDEPEEVNPDEENPGEPNEENPGEETPDEVTPDEPNEENPSEPGQENPDQSGEVAPSEPDEENPDQSGEEIPSEPDEETPGQSGEEIPGEPDEVTPDQSGEEIPGEPDEVTPDQSGEGVHDYFGGALRPDLQSYTFPNLRASFSQSHSDFYLKKALPFDFSSTNLAHKLTKEINQEEEISQALPPMPEGTVDGVYTISLEEINEGKVGTFTFPEISYEEPGTYVYELSENTQNLPSNIVCEVRTYFAQVNVVAKNGRMVVDSIKYYTDADLQHPIEGENVTFVNKYAPQLIIEKEQCKTSQGVTSDWNKLDYESPMEVVGGDTVTYKVTVTNTSNTTAQNVVITDTIPSPIPEGSQGNLTLVETSQGNATLEGATLTWDLGDLQAEESRTITFQVTIPKVASETIWPNTASVKYGPDKDHPLDQIDSNTVVIKETPSTPNTPGGGGSTPKPSISLVKEQRKISPDGTTSNWNKHDRTNPMQVNPGDVIEYRITASNTSSTAAQNVVIKDTIPLPEGSDAQLVLDESSLQGQDVTINGRELTWKVGTLTRKGSNGSSKSVTFKVTVPQVSANTLWENVAHATFGSNPNNPSGSMDSNKVDSSTNPNSNMTLVKEQRKISGTTSSEWNTYDRTNPMIVAGGDIVEYRLTATATGTKPLENVTIRDTIPPFEGSPGNLTLVPGSASGNVSITDTTLTWHLGTMQPGQSQSVTFQVVVPLTQGQTLWSNMATVSHGEDPNNPEETIPSNTVVIEENPSDAKIKLLKEQRKISPDGTISDWNTQDRSNPMIVTGGDVVEYRLTTTVVGQATLPNVTIREPIPTYEGSPGDLVLLPESLSGEVNVENGIITWHLGTMQPGESRSVMFQVRIPTTQGQTLWSNVASVSYGEDPNHPEETIPSNVVTIVENPSSAEPDISLVKEQRLIRNGVASNWNTQGRDNPMQVQANDLVEYRLTVTNKTMHSVPNVVVRDTVPSPSGSSTQLTLVNQSTTKGTVNVDGQNVVWTIGTLAPQEVVTVSFQVRVPSVSTTTLWPNIGSATYGEDPNHPDREVPSNEVDIQEPVNTTSTTTPNNNPGNNNTNTPNNNTNTSNNTNNTNKPETNSSSPNKASTALTGLATNSSLWLGLLGLSLVALGLGYWWYKKKKA